jgi:hypothetical protein
MKSCSTDPDTCRRQHAADRLGLMPNPRSPGDFEGKCPACGHGGFALSKPTLTKMRNMWSCNCKTCNGRKGCPVKVIRAAMIRKGVSPWCLGSYIGKDKPEADLDRLRRIAQAVDDLINCRPNLSAADMVMALAEARGDKIPDDYGECAAFARKLGMSNGNAYNVAAKWTAGPESRVTPQNGVAVDDTSSTTETRNRVNTPRSEAQDLPEVGNGSAQDSNSWTEPTLDDAPVIPKVGKRTLDDGKNRRPAA